MTCAVLPAGMGSEDACSTRQVVRAARPSARGKNPVVFIVSALHTDSIGVSTATTSAATDAPAATAKTFVSNDLHNWPSF